MPPADAVIRPLTPADAAAYMALRREMLEDAPWAFAASPETDVALDPESLAEILAGEPGRAIIGAIDPRGDGHDLLAAAGIYRDRHPKMAHRARIWGVYTTPSARGRGLAARVITAAIDLARSWAGVSSIGLSASERSTDAIRLYRRLGFEPWGTEPAAVVLDGHAYAEVHMVLFLEPEQPSSSPTSPLSSTRGGT